MPQHPHLGMHALVVPTLGIDGIRAKYLQVAALDLRRQHANHPPVFIFKKPPHGRRKNQQRTSRVPEHQQIHVPVQFLAVSLVIFAIHSLAVSADGISYLNRAPFQPAAEFRFRTLRGRSPRPPRFRPLTSQKNVPATLPGRSYCSPSRSYSFSSLAVSELERRHVRAPVKAAGRLVILRRIPKGAVIHRIDLHRTVISPAVEAVRLYAGARLDDMSRFHPP